MSEPQTPEITPRPAAPTEFGELAAQVEIIDAAPWFDMIEARFGIPTATFDGHLLVRPNKRRLHLIRREHRPTAEPPCQIIGMSFVHTQMKYPKLSTAAAMAFGPHATRNRVQLTPAQADRFLSRETFDISAAQCARVEGPGYILAFIDECCLGVGLFHPNDAPSTGGHIHSMIPRAWAMAEDASAFDSAFAPGDPPADLSQTRGKPGPSACRGRVSAKRGSSR